MAATMNGDVQLAAAREVASAKPNDARVLKPYSPGCEELNMDFCHGLSSRSRTEAIA